MPNNVLNELIFRNTSPLRQEAIIEKLCDAKGCVDFEILVPLPLNVWWGSVGSEHERAFKRTALDWCRGNWGTKWNAYHHYPIDRTSDAVTFKFQTAWNPPYPWLAAVMNSLKCEFEHNWLSEYDNQARTAKFDFSIMKSDRGLGMDAWSERIADDAMQRRLHLLKWGVEKFEDEA